jgi:hypothetical protein
MQDAVSHLLAEPRLALSPWRTCWRRAVPARAGTSLQLCFNLVLHHQRFVQLAEAVVLVSQDLCVKIIFDLLARARAQLFAEPGIFFSEVREQCAPALALLLRNAIVASTERRLLVCLNCLNGMFWSGFWCTRLLLRLHAHGQGLPGPCCCELYSWACLLPRVWVWGFWFGFALRRVALLCGVCVRLHLALFPAGGPFLPSLSVNIAGCLAMWRVHATAPCFVSGWRAFSSVSLCKCVNV